MLITTRSNQILLMIQTLACIGGTLMIAIGQKNDMSAYWILIIFFCAYGSLMIMTTTYLSCFKSPEYLELKETNLIIKYPFRDSFAINITHIIKIDRTSLLLILQRTYNIKMHCSPENLTIYLGKDKFENLDKFLRELKKANPKCQIDEWLM